MKVLGSPVRGWTCTSDPWRAAHAGGTGLPRTRAGRPRGSSGRWGATCSRSPSSPASTRARRTWPPRSGRPPTTSRSPRRRVCSTASSELFSFTWKASALPSQEGDPAPQRGAPVLRPLVRVEEHLLRAAPLPPVEDGLLLRRGPSPVEHPAAALQREHRLLDVEDLLEPLGDRAPLRQGGQEVAGEPVLGRHPGIGARRLHVLQPAVGIGDGDAVDHVHDLLAGRGGVGEGSGHRGSGRGGPSGGGGAGGEEGGGDERGGGGREPGREAGHGVAT